MPSAETLQLRATIYQRAEAEEKAIQEILAAMRFIADADEKTSREIRLFKYMLTSLAMLNALSLGEFIRLAADIGIYDKDFLEQWWIYPEKLKY